MDSLITLDTLQKVAPRSVRGNITQEMVDRINGIVGDSEVKEAYRDNLLSYISVLNDGKFKIDSYIDAVKYVSYKLMGSSNISAYIQAFPDRYQKLVDKGTSEKDISSYVTAYNKNKLVNLIMEQTLVPSYVLNADMYQKALNVQADLMMNANSEKVRSDAANSILVHLKMPETTKIELDVGVKQDKCIDDLRNSTLELVAQQRKMLEAGAMSMVEIANSKIVRELVEG